MASEQYQNIQEGPITKGAVVEEFISSSSNLPRWAPVVLAAAGTNETLPRVTTTTTSNNKSVIGVSVGPNRSSGYCADNAGDSVQVVTFGATKCKVLGSSSTIAIGTVLETSATAGNAQAATSGDKNGFAVALYAGTNDGDIIPVYVKGGITG